MVRSEYQQAALRRAVDGAVRMMLDYKEDLDFNNVGSVEDD